MPTRSECFAATSQVLLESYKLPKVGVTFPPSVARRLDATRLSLQHAGLLPEPRARREMISVCGNQTPQTQ